MKKAIIAVVSVIGLIVVLAVLVLGNINSIIQQGIETVGPDILGAPVKVAGVNVSFLSGTGEITGLKIANPEGYGDDHAMVIDQIHIEFDPMSVTSDKICIRKMVVDSPSIDYVGDLHDSNIQQLQRNAEVFAGNSDGAADSQLENSEGGGPSVEIGFLEVKDANISVTLDFLRGKPVVLTLPSLTLEDIGKDEDVSMAEVLKMILKQLNTALLPMLKESVVGDQLRAQKKKLKKSLKGEVDRLKSMFKPS